jgi:hypothetical protein
MFDHNYKDLNSEQQINPHQLVCTAVSWNSTGNTLGVSAPAELPRPHTRTHHLAMADAVTRRYCAHLIIVWFPSDRVSVSSPAVESSRASPPHRPREDGLARPADASRSNLAALGLLSRRLSETLFGFQSSGGEQQSRHRTGRERKGSPALQTLYAPISRRLGSAFRTLTLPYPTSASGCVRAVRRERVVGRAGRAVHMEPGQEGARGSAGGAPQAGRDGGVRQPSAGAWAGGGNEWIREIAN